MTNLINRKCLKYFFLLYPSSKKTRKDGCRNFLPIFYTRYELTKILLLQHLWIWPQNLTLTECPCACCVLCSNTHCIYTPPPACRCIRAGRCRWRHARWSGRGRWRRTAPRGTRSRSCPCGTPRACGTQCPTGTLALPPLSRQFSAVQMIKLDFAKTI